MKRLHLAYALACLLAGAAAPAFAQTTAGVADPQSAVPATTYQPAIRPDAAPTAAATATTSPDQAWRAANATVGGRNAMSLTMPGMGGHDMRDTAPAAAPAGPQCGGGNGMQCMAGGGCGDGCCSEQGCCGGDGPASGHDHHTGMTMGAAASGQQCMAGGGKGCCGGEKCCCAGKSAAADDASHGSHAGHAGMAMEHGCCDHKEAR